MKSNKLSSPAAILLAAFFIFKACGSAQAQELLDVEVRANPVTEAISQQLSPPSVVSGQSIEENSYQHFQDIIEQIPNLNWSSGSNRPRFFQIRGIGELEQYAGAPNSSVTFLIDDFDLSSMGSAGTLYDIDHVTVARGPQGFWSGPGALAGTIQLISKQPTETFHPDAEVSLGNDNLWSVGAAAGGAIIEGSKDLQFRLSAQEFQSDGFRHNEFLNRDNTNGRDELTTKAKLIWAPTTDFSLDLNLLHIDIDDGYDAFAIDNSLTTQSDRPGNDKQETNGVSSKLRYDLNEDVELSNTFTFSHSDVDYSYDGDWGNNPFWGVNAPYDFFSQTLRSRHQLTNELKFGSDTDKPVTIESARWAAGLYQSRLTENSSDHQSQDGFEYATLSSDYLAKSSAVFGAAAIPIFKKTALNFGLRAETRDSTYTDSALADFSPHENFYGALAGIAYELVPLTELFANFSRGYKGGGFNSGISVPSDRRTYSPESLINFEVGLKDVGPGPLSGSLTLFADFVRNQQVKIALQDNPSDPLAFTYLTDNSARGTHIGAETELDWLATDQVKFYFRGGLLSAKIYDYVSGDQNLDGRDQAHSPTWQQTSGVRYQLTQEVFTDVSVSGQDGFYFDDSNNQKSKAYAIANMTIGYECGSWSWTIWARNIFDKRYATRGFYFGNEPPDFPNKLYVQLGDPRQIGTTLAYHF